MVAFNLTTDQNTSVVPSQFSFDPISISLPPLNLAIQLKRSAFDWLLERQNNLRLKDIMNSTTLTLLLIHHSIVELAANSYMDCYASWSERRRKGFRMGKS
jgi:hypothetical protein